MYWLDKLREYKFKSKETYRSIAEKTDIPQTTIEKIFSGRTRDPKLNMMEKISACVGCSVADLVERKKDDMHFTGDEEKIILDIRKLDNSGKAQVTHTIRHELERTLASKAVKIKKLFPTIYYDFPVSAGTGEFLDSTTATVIQLEEEPPYGTDFVLRIAGDSMEPEFSDGDLIYVQKRNLVYYGDIGIFVYCGSVYMKEYTELGLRSLNPNYELIPGSPDMQCLGRVLGKVNGEVI